MHEPPPADGAEDLLGSVLYRFADESTVGRIQRRYVHYFTETGARSVLDVGCGRGIFLGLLADAGIDAVGVDSNAEAVAGCIRKGHTRVFVADAVNYLQQCVSKGEQFDGVFCSHVVEHMDGPEGVRLLGLLCDVVAPGGRVLVATPNVMNLWTWTRTFWADPTHVRPYPRLLLEALLEAKQLEIHASFDDRFTRRAIGGWRGLLRLPADVLMLGTSPFQGGDSIVVGQRPVSSTELG